MKMRTTISIYKGLVLQRGRTDTELATSDCSKLLPSVG